MLQSAMPNRSSKKDFSQVAFRIVQAATEPPEPPDAETVTHVMKEMGRRGGLKGGKARAEKLTPEQRSEIAKKGAKARWKK